MYRRPGDRHFIVRIRRNTPVKDENTVIEPWVDVAADVAAINGGLATRDRGVFTINGRRYGIEDNDRLYPIDGPGFHRLDRQAYKALRAYNTHGYTAAARIFVTKSPISRQQHAAALRAWRAGQRGSQ